jgi:hypothetical protein
MTKPNYALLLNQIAQETNPIIKQQLIEQCYVFTEELTEEEIELFGYVQDDYIENNPGLVGNNLKSYVGVYYDEDNNKT